jgi:hypothetical protein
MKSRANTQLVFSDWPDEDRSSWEAAFRAGEFLDDQGGGAHLAPASRAGLKATYGHFLGFLVRRHPHLLELPTAKRVDRAITVTCVEQLRQTRQDSSIAAALHHLRLALELYVRVRIGRGCTP